MLVVTGEAIFVRCWDRRYGGVEVVCVVDVSKLWR